MRERLEQILKIICIALAVLLLAQLGKVAFRVNPLSGVVIPELPSLPADTNTPAKVVGNGPMKLATNAAVVAAAGSKTNIALAGANTNVVSHPKSKEGESNSAPTQVAITEAVTNKLGTNIMAADTNAVTTNAAIGTNVVVALATTNGTSSTNSVVAIAKTNGASNTNVVIAKSARGKKSQPMLPPMMGPGGMKASSLPPDIQARVDRVTESEILGPVIHPMPMALLGIAGKVAFLRSPSGQTGLVKEGEELGEIKLLRIGVNRVLIELAGQKKELMIFSGFGGESLLPKSTETSDETTKK